MNLGGANNQLRDPTWYRVRYAMTVRRMQSAQHISSAGVGKSGWPKGLVGGKRGWRDEFGEETQRLLVSLFEDQRVVAGDEGVSPALEPAVSALEGAEGLLVTTMLVLNDAGWHWVGRKPPRYLPFAKRFGSWGKRLLRDKEEGTVAGDKKLTRFLSDVVEPGAVILYCSARLLADPDEYDALRDAVVDRAAADLPPLDRRKLDPGNVKSWSLDYLSTFLADQEVDSRPHARVGATLGRTQYRKPRDPTPRARYSLACLLSRLGEEAKKRSRKTERGLFLSSAAAQLDGAFSDAVDSRRNRLAEWSWSDPDLDALRRWDKSAFATIVAGWRHPSAARSPGKGSTPRTSLGSGTWRTASCWSWSLRTVPATSTQKFRRSSMRSSARGIRRTRSSVTRSHPGMQRSGSAARATQKLILRCGTCYKLKKGEAISRHDERHPRHWRHARSRALLLFLAI